MDLSLLTIIIIYLLYILIWVFVTKYSGKHNDISKNEYIDKYFEKYNNISQNEHMNNYFENISRYSWEKTMLISEIAAKENIIKIMENSISDKNKIIELLEKNKLNKTDAKPEDQNVMRIPTQSSIE